MSAAAGEKEASAWTRVQLGLLYLNSGRPGKALGLMREAGIFASAKAWRVAVLPETTVVAGSKMEKAPP